MKVNSEIIINNKKIGLDHPTYFIADIAANHDGDLERAKALIHEAADAGADAAKFQHFSAETIVSDYGFKQLETGMSHQENWEKSVYEVYERASVSMDWTKSLIETCRSAQIDFFTSPYSIELVDKIDPFVPAYKVGSGDITWLEIIRHMASKGKPVLLATGASNLQEVAEAVSAILERSRDIVLMQCNTNYTASLENFKYIQLNVLKTYSEMFPKIILGLSDHTPGHATALGAVALGARMIEKHFTDDNDRVGPDHRFAMNPQSWKEMVDRTRELENALGTGLKQVEENEKETVIVQRRAVRAVRALVKGDIINADNVEVLRPCPDFAISPSSFSDIQGLRLRNSIPQGEVIRWIDLE
ncbi:N-acetylneuraminate synthase family protein [Akkermansiaceae bacterium]|nr:N-acetylneuraminate synthase family protein [Akkermansiaceae bacterium]